MMSFITYNVKTTKLISNFLLFLLPATLIVISIFYKNSVGEFYLGGYYDPSYVYLINSLNLSQLSGYGVGHFDHPGIPIQVVGAMVIKILYTIQSVNSDIVKDVFSRPEYYLMRINLIFVLMNASALLILGFVSYKKTNNIYEALFLQLSPFSFSVIYYKLTDVSSESLLIFSVLLLIAIIIAFVNEKEMTRNKLIKYTLLFGILCGFGLSCKILFFPLLIIPILLLNRISFKALFLLIAFLSFCVIFFSVLPANKFLAFLDWVFNLATRSGKYGQGDQNFIDTTKVFVNIKLIFDRAPVFTISYILITISILLSFFKKFKVKIRNNKYFKLLIGLFLTITVQILLVVKQFNSYYMISVYLLSILGLLIVYSIFYDFNPNFLTNNRRIIIIYFLILIVVFYYNYKIIANNVSYFDQRREQSREAIRYLSEHYDQSLIVGTVGSSNKVVALFMGVIYGGSQAIKYYSILREQFPNYIIYNIWGKKKLAFLGSGEDTETKFVNSKKFFFLVNGQEVFKKFMEEVKQISNNATSKNIYLNTSGEAIYEISLDSTK